MIRRVWTKTDSAASTEQELFRYDFGEYEGWLIGDKWQSWKIVSVTKDGDNIVQELVEMPGDFCAFKAYSVEKIPIGYSGKDIHMDGWCIKSGS
jgi:hypothetical protein